MDQAARPLPNLNMLLLVVISAVSLALGPVVLATGRVNQGVMRSVDTFVLVAIGGLAALHILPEAIDRCGIRAAIAALTGLLALGTLEHLPRRSTASFVSSSKLGILAVAFHAFVDGVGLGVSNGSLLALATIVHRVPEGLVVWSLSEPERNTRRAVMNILSLIAINAFGAVVSSRLASLLESDAIVLLQAFAVGTLIHVLFDRMKTAVLSGRNGTEVPVFVGAVAGALGVATAMFFAPDHPARKLASLATLSDVRLALGIAFVAATSWLLVDNGRRIASQARPMKPIVPPQTLPFASQTGNKRPR